MPAINQLVYMISGQVSAGKYSLLPTTHGILTARNLALINWVHIHKYVDRNSKKKLKYALSANVESLVIVAAVAARSRC
ncbi:hypothetical protein TELCIR_01923 [Teladorsagia circumcincta]|uniref:Uncharacterized protein n=1 Tax=Teladorsagia circumcincta TaxID=45464 RepID=A0A2G9V0J3_TELCI|nr:hypothetical protein TELCIR_01923 [Teladorsagia circumcincta]